MLVESRMLRCGFRRRKHTGGENKVVNYESKGKREFEASGVDFFLSLSFH